MFLLLIFLFSSSLAFQPTCTNIGKSRTIRLSVNSTKSPEGIWMDGISAWVVMSNSLNVTQMDIARTITDCDEGRIIHIEGMTPVSRFQETRDRLKFHQRCGKNVVISGNGFTAQRMKIEIPHDAVVFTNRPLKNGEMFEVKLEERSNKFSWASGIGIVTKSPENIEIFSEMFKSPDAWMYYDTSLYNNGIAVERNIGVNIYNLQAGDTMGVMRNEQGTLHFFINGKDQGPAKYNVPPNVYGVLDLWQNYHKASIV